MRKILLMCVSVSLTLCLTYACSAESENERKRYSEVQDDENVVFFRTTAWLDGENWHVPIHGWIYEPESSVGRKAIAAAILKDKFGLAQNSHTEKNFAQRFNLLIADNERGKNIVVAIAGRHVALPASQENGHFKSTLVISAADVDRHSEGQFLGYSAVMRKGEKRRFTGKVQLVGPSGLSIISDIDDTVKISNVTNRKDLLEHAFLLDFIAAPGMAELYDGWFQSEEDMSLHFVSSSPWQLYPPLQKFLDSNDFPWGAASLKSVRFRDETLFDLFKQGTETKPPVIAQILDTYAGRHFMLVGDSGEQDPEVYAELMRQRPDQIRGIYIRNVTQERRDNRRFKSVFNGIEDDRWVLFDDPSSLIGPQNSWPQDHPKKRGAR